MDRRTFLQLSAAGLAAPRSVLNGSQPGRSSSAAARLLSGRLPQTRTLRQSENPYLAGNFAPVAEERTATALPVSGQLPASLTGWYRRSGPNPVSIANEATQCWFPGDGMIHAVQLADGKAVSYRNRYVRTNSMADHFGEPHRPGPDPVVFDGSNTNIVSFAGQILSVAEGSLPYRLDENLETIERVDFGGLPNGLSAHCKFDPEAGELHNISYSFRPPYAVWQVIDATGAVTRTVPIDIAAPGMWHTFSLTKRYVVLYDVPVVYNVQRIADGYFFPFAWDAGHPMRVGLIDRAGDGSVRWLDMEQCMVNHDVGALDTADGVTVYATVSERIFDREPRGPLETPPHLERIDINTTTGTVRRTKVDDAALEFPRTAPTVWDRPARFVYAVGAGPGVAGGGVLEPGNSIVKYDSQTGTTSAAPMGSSRATGEAVFVADPERTTDEDGGWLVSYVYDATTDRSDLVVVDAQDMAAGPVATVGLGSRVPFGFHGNWFPG